MDLTSHHDAHGDTTNAAPMSREELRSWHGERICEAQHRHWSALASISRLIEGQDDGTTMADVESALADFEKARAAARADGFVVNTPHLYSPATVTELRIED